MAFVPVVLDSGVAYTSKGAKRQACADMAEWLVWLERLQVARGRCLVLKLYQAQGSGPYSGDTHDCGSAVDTVDYGDAYVLDVREMGGDGWARRAVWGWTKGDHVHIVLPCGHNACNQFQIDAYNAGYNGLGNGYAGRDPHTRPAVKRTWRQGIEWAKAEIARITGSTSTDTAKDDDMKALLKVKGAPAVYLSDGVTAYHIVSEEALADVVTLSDEGTLPVKQAVPNGSGSVLITCHNAYGQVIRQVWVREVGRADLLGKVVA